MSLWRNLLFAARCALCGAPLRPDTADPICPDCLLRVHTELRADGGKPVPGCAETDAALLYRGDVRSLMLRIKYRRRLPLARRWLGRLVGARVLAHQAHWQPDLVTYVPTSLNHWWRRGFNLSALLAREAAAHCGLPCQKTLRRSLFSRYQAGMRTAADRERNVRTAYSPRRGVRLDGKRVVLVDDILSTGATAAACAALLRQLGAAEVYLVCAAKTPGRRAKLPENAGKPRAQS